MKGFLLILLVVGLSGPALAINYPYLMRSPKALLMGDAYTALNDDEYTLFYNPASLARHKSDLTLTPFPGHISGTNVLKDLDRFEDFPKEPVGAADVLMDYPIHASAGVAPGFKLFNVGFNFIANESFDASLRNPAHPMLDLDLRSDRGVIVGVGIPMGPNRISKKGAGGSQTSIGVGAKFIKRKGILDSYSFTGPTFTNALDQDEVDQVLRKLGQVEGQGWGFDAGLEHMVRAGNTQFSIGLAALDITGTDFKVEKNAQKQKVANIDDQINLGLAGGQDFGLFHYILSADVRALNEEMDFGKRLRFGAQVGIPSITFMAGVNSGYYSYGAQLDLKFMKLSGGFYDVELGSKYKQTQSKRFILYLSLFDFSFDA